MVKRPHRERRARGLYPRSSHTGHLHWFHGGHLAKRYGVSGRTGWSCVSTRWRGQTAGKFNLQCISQCGSVYTSLGKQLHWSLRFYSMLLGR